MDLKDFSYELPEELIGQTAIEPRDSCKLMVLDKINGTISHRVFNELPKILDKNYVLVINDTKVFPARIYGNKDTGGKIELLLLKQLGLDSFVALVRGKVKVGQTMIITPTLKTTVISKSEEGEVTIKFNLSGTDLTNSLDEIGKTPLPPYIHSDVEESKLRQQYQTIYAREKGSAAAPTAGLHFTPNLMEKLAQNGVQIEKVTLHVGLGTFKPVTEEQIIDKKLHKETYQLDEGVAQRLNEAKRSGKKIIAVGTTTCRVLETLSDETGYLKSGKGETDIFIQPWYKFKFIDGMITNFHLPQTSLLMLVSALISKPNSPTPFKNFSESLIGKAYSEAVKEKYKFFSFGDAMLIL